MRVRHRIPAIFSLSMVDMLCCALGCVILLWLLNAKYHEDSVEEQAKANATLEASARAEREKLLARLSALLADRDKKGAALKAVTADRDDAYALLRELNDRLRGLESNRADLRRRLSAREEESKRLAGRLKEAEGKVVTLEAGVRAGEKRLESEKARADMLGGKLSDAESRLKGLRADLESARGKYASEQGRAKALDKEIARRKQELDRLTRTVEEMEGAKGALEKALEGKEKELAAARAYKGRWTAAEGRVRALEADARRLRAAAENRFAGVELTGRRVVFLVDTSGSMEMLDSGTSAPAKWREVRATVARVMRSLPDLEKFQVITFAARPSYLLGSPGRWLDYDPKSSPERVRKALAAIKPDGGTNMYSALEAAFRLRIDGLDTVYLLSDGLPNLGEGLTAEQARTLREVDRGAVLGRYVRNKLKTVWNRPHPAAKRVRIHTIGFFYESPDLGAFLWALARENEGSFVGMSKP
jgi:predicted  nucleic acid-binding Zn-ribbon protein